MSNKYVPAVKVGGGKYIPAVKVGGKIVTANVDASDTGANDKEEISGFTGLFSLSPDKLEFDDFISELSDFEEEEKGDLEAKKVEYLNHIAWWNKYSNFILPSSYPSVTIPLDTVAPEIEYDIRNTPVRTFDRLEASINEYSFLFAKTCISIKYHILGEESNSNMLFIILKPRKIKSDYPMPKIEIQARLKNTNVKGKFHNRTAHVILFDSVEVNGRTKGRLYNADSWKSFSKNRYIADVFDNIKIRIDRGAVLIKSIKIRLNGECIGTQDYIGNSGIVCKDYPGWGTKNLDIRTKNIRMEEILKTYRNSTKAPSSSVLIASVKEYGQAWSRKYADDNTEYHKNEDDVWCSNFAAYILNKVSPLHSPYATAWTRRNLEIIFQIYNQWIGVRNDAFTFNDYGPFFIHKSSFEYAITHVREGDYCYICYHDGIEHATFFLNWCDDEGNYLKAALVRKEGNKKMTWFQALGGNQSSLVKVTTFILTTSPNWSAAIYPKIRLMPWVDGNHGGFGFLL